MKWHHECTKIMRHYNLAIPNSWDIYMPIYLCMYSIGGIYLNVGGYPKLCLPLRDRYLLGTISAVVLKRMVPESDEVHKKHSNILM